MGVHTPKFVHANLIVGIGELAPANVAKRNLEMYVGAGLYVN